MHERCLESVGIKAEPRNQHSPDAKIEKNIQQKYDHTDGFQTAEAERNCGVVSMILSASNGSRVSPVCNTLASPPVAIVSVK